MTAQRIRLAAPDAGVLREGFERIREELHVPEVFPPGALDEAEGAAAAPRPPATDATDVPFFTIDPPGSRDLDQAMHLERRTPAGYRVRYAIADLAAFVTPGGALDTAVWARGVTYYMPDGSTPLHPPVLSEGAASLLPGEPRPAVLWTLDLDAGGALERTDVRRALVRSRLRLDYARAQVPTSHTDDDPLRLLAEVGALREAAEVARGGVNLRLPEQEVLCAPDGSYDVAYRAPLPVEGFNAQISLLTGIAAARLMLDAGIGLLRTVPPPDPPALERLRRAAAALGVAWPPDTPYPEFIRGVDPATPAGAALLREATSVMRGAAYVAFDGDPPEHARHSALATDYAHVTAPLRRLADRYALECSLAACAGEAPPDWVRSRLADLPKAMADADRRANGVERAAIDLVEAARLAGRVGETFAATVIDDGVIQLKDPAVRARCDGDPPVGHDISARLVEADPATRSVRFDVAA
jgi:exoribonuclease R